MPASDAPPAPARLTVAIGALAAAPAPASAAGAPYNCEASALRGTLLTLPAIEPVIANRGAPECRAVKAGGADLLAGTGLPLTAGVLGAQTVVGGTAERRDEQAVLATGGVANLAISALPALGLTLPPLDQLIPPALQSVSVTIPEPLGTTLALLGVPRTITVGLGPALQALLPANLLSDLDPVDVQGAYANAGARCENGRATPFGTSQVAGLKVLGQEIAVSGPGTQDASLPVIDTARLDLSQLDLTKLVLPQVLTNLLGTANGGLVTQLLQNVIRPVVTALPPITIPAQLAQVRITPGTQVVADGRLTQQALRVQISALGQNIADLVLGEASVSTAGVDCTPPAAPAPAQTAADLALACTSRRLVLTDVYERDGRVQLIGAADRRLAGRTVTIRFEGDRTAAEARIAPDGAFRTTARLPARGLRATNRARYVAIVGQEKSLNLKLRRRMAVSGVRASDGRVTIAGRVVRPLAAPSRRSR